jgi:hypothetical protein
LFLSGVITKLERQIVEEEKISMLTKEFQRVCNWFNVNQITMEDLDDEQPFYSQMSEDMNILEMREAMLKYVNCISSNGIASLSSTAAVGVTHVIELMEEKPFSDKYDSFRKLLEQNLLF